MTIAIHPNLPHKILDTVTPSNALESDVFALPARGSLLNVQAYVTGAAGGFTATVTIAVSLDIDAPFVELSDEIDLTNSITVAFVDDTNPWKFIKVILSDVASVVAAKLTVEVIYKDQ